MICDKEVHRLQNDRDKFERYFHLLNHWMTARHHGHSVVDYLLHFGYKRIAIYGMGYLAAHIIDDIQGSDIEIAYGIDREICNSNAPLDDIYSPDDSLPVVDVVIVTPYTSFLEIKNDLSKKMDCPVISLENVIWSI